MLSRTVLVEMSRFKKLPLAYTEKDYLNDICLNEISRYRTALVFKGGTALYKFYKLNRFSEDLDFSINKRKFDYEMLKKRVGRSFGLLNIEVVTAQLEAHQRGATIVFMIKGPLYNGSRESLARLPMDFSSRERPREHKMVQYRSLYNEIPPMEICVMDKEEITAEKVRAILTRNKPRDVFDLWFLLDSGVDIEEQLVDRKLKLYDSPFSLEGLISALEEKRGLWETDLRNKVIGRLPEFDVVIEDIKKRFRKAIGEKKG